MKKRLLTAFASTLFLLLALFVLAEIFTLSGSGNPDDEKSEQLVALSDISGCINEGKTADALASIEKMRADIVRGKSQRLTNPWIIVSFAVSLCFVCGIFIYVWLTVLLPFEKMKEYAGEVAAGNLDLPLDLSRGSYFGAFTWAFDSMRREIVRARSAEKEALNNGKTVIASLSHDIKTPVSSLLLYAEALEANMDTSIEKRKKYTDIIKAKCEEIARLTNDLFVHSLSEMGRISITEENVNLTEFVAASVTELCADGKSVTASLPEKPVVICADRKRLVQICENLTNNAAKYAKTPVCITLRCEEDNAVIVFKDEGPGIPDSDLPFVFGKFYRGKNTGDENGSGLGLFIVKELTEKMGGSVMLANKCGLEVTLAFPISKQ